MDIFRSVARFPGVVVTLILLVAVSGALGDGINSGRHQNSLIKGETAGTSWGSARIADLSSGWHQGGFAETYSGSRFADFNSGSLGQNEFFERTNGIRAGYWLRLSLDNHDGNSINPGAGSSTATPEPASLLLLVTGAGPFIYARRRARKA